MIQITVKKLKELCSTNTYRKLLSNYCFSIATIWGLPSCDHNHTTPQLHNTTLTLTHRADRWVLVTSSGQLWPAIDLTADVVDWRATWSRVTVLTWFCVQINKNTSKLFNTHDKYFPLESLTSIDFVFQMWSGRRGRLIWRRDRRSYVTPFIMVGDVCSRGQMDIFS